MDCTRCGGANREGAKFCRHCGAPLVEQQAASSEQQAASSEQQGVALEPGAPAEAGPEPAPQEPEFATAEPSPPEEQHEGPAPTPTAEVGPEMAPEEGQQEEGVPAPVAEEGIEGTGEESTQQAGRQEQVPEAGPEPGAPEGAEGYQPISPGTVVADRYLVLETMDSQEAETLYSARDLRRCWQCGFAENAPDDAFCARCGASLDRKVSVRLLEVREGQESPRSGAAVAERLTDQGRTFLLLTEPEPAPAATVVPSARLVAGHRSDPGRVRDLNEDSLLAMIVASTFESRTDPLLGLFAVADGMGGHEGGEVASKLALQVLGESVMRTFVLPALAGGKAREEEITARLSEAVAEANEEVYLARQKRGTDMGTTLTTALVRNDRLLLAHVGDSRAYRWSAEGLSQLTTDHSLVASLIAAGRAAPEEIYTHPQRNVISRSVGDRPEVEVDTAVLPLAPGDRLILCSDGLWEMVHDEGIADALMQEADVQAACDLLVKRANAAGGEDNVSVIVVQVVGG